MFFILDKYGCVTTTQPLGNPTVDKYGYVTTTQPLGNPTGNSAPSSTINQNAAPLWTNTSTPGNTALPTTINPGTVPGNTLPPSTTPSTNPNTASTTTDYLPTGRKEYQNTISGNATTLPTTDSPVAIINISFPETNTEESKVIKNLLQNTNVDGGGTPQNPILGLELFPFLNQALKNRSSLINDKPMGNFKDNSHEPENHNNSSLAIIPSNHNQQFFNNINDGKSKQKLLKNSFLSNATQNYEAANLMDNPNTSQGIKPALNSADNSTDQNKYKPSANLADNSTSKNYKTTTLFMNNQTGQGATDQIQHPTADFPTIITKENPTKTTSISVSSLNRNTAQPDVTLPSSSHPNNNDNIQTKGYEMFFFLVCLLLACVPQNNIKLIYRVCYFSAALRSSHNR